MPSQNPRVMLTIPKELNDVLQRAADLQEIPKTRLIVNCLEEVKQPLIELIAALELVQQKKDPTHLLMGVAARMLQEFGTEISLYNEKMIEAKSKPQKDVSNGDD